MRTAFRARAKSGWLDRSPLDPAAGRLDLSIYRREISAADSCADPVRVPVRRPADHAGDGEEIDQRQESRR